MTVYTVQAISENNIYGSKSSTSSQVLSMFLMAKALNFHAFTQIWHKSSNNVAQKTDYWAP